MEQNNNYQNNSFQNGSFQNGNFQNGSIQGNTALNNDQQYVNQAYMTGHSPMLNGQPMSTDKMAAEMEKQENVLLGIVGAIGGALIGVAVMALIYYLNFFAAFAGIVMVVCAILGYAKLSGVMSVKGIIIGAIISLAMVYVGARFCFAIELSRAYPGYNVFEAFVEADEKIARNDMFADAFTEILLKQYLFAGIGVVLELFDIRKRGTAGLGAFRK